MVTGRALAIWFQSFRLGACNSAHHGFGRISCKRRIIFQILPAIWQPFESDETTEEMTLVKQRLKTVAEFISKTKSSRACLRWQNPIQSFHPQNLAESGRSLGQVFFQVPSSKARPGQRRPWTPNASERSFMWGSERSYICALRDFLVYCIFI